MAVHGSRFSGFFRPQARPYELLFAGKTADTKAVSGPELYQGQLPDCQLLASIYMTLRGNPDAMKAMLTPNKDGSYSVIFPGGPQHKITVHPAEFAQQQASGSERPAQVTAQDDDIRLVETAYARWLKKHYPLRFKDADKHNIRSVYQQPGFDTEIFTTGFAYHMLTGREMNVIVKPDILLKDTPCLNLAKTERERQTPAYEQTLRDHLQTIAKNPRALDMVLIANPTPPDLHDPKSRFQYVDASKKILSYHAFIVEEVDLENDRVLLKDPHNTRLGFMLPVDDILRMFYKAYVAEK